MCLACLPTNWLAPAYPNDSAKVSFRCGKGKRNVGNITMTLTTKQMMTQHTSILNNTVHTSQDFEKDTTPEAAIMASINIISLLLVSTVSTLAQSTIFVTPVAVSPTSNGPVPPTPPTSTLDTSPSTSSSCTICADYVNDCGIWYGGCFEACDGAPWPSFTPPPCPTSSSSAITPSISNTTTTSSNSASTITSAPVYLSPYGSNSSCDKVICVDYINTCDIKYGGCFPVCSDHTTPTFTNPGCPSGAFRSSFSKSVIRTTRTNSCGYSCDYRIDDCGNTYGPGCYTSCPGAEVPGYTIPVCEVTTATSLMAVAAETTMVVSTSSSTDLNAVVATGTEPIPTLVPDTTGDIGGPARLAVTAA
ncbi:hypothetical protein HII31_06381 [Pseudocercospora fuligena]|uniref:Uncharacterized protein n=1 Tax=Pseudocercospora fuligena TaxID=685502 RepID=A0A8H6RJV2_9PEZI|nr:hypothetical protein HII31_06381 [Pseudocercospora fuligena]